jgi:hypothetical protein
MAFSAEFAVRLGEEFFGIRLVRVVAGDALTVFNRLMLELALVELVHDILMALGTEFAIRFGKEFLGI